MKNKLPKKLSCKLNLAKVNLENKICKGVAEEKAVKKVFIEYFLNHDSKPEEKKYHVEILESLQKHCQDKTQFSRYLKNSYGRTLTSKRVELSKKVRDKLYLNERDYLYQGP